MKSPPSIVEGNLVWWILNYLLAKDLVVWTECPKKAQSLPRLVNDFETMLSIVGSSCQRSSCSLWSLVVGTQQPGRWQLAQGGCTIYNSPLNPWLLLLSTTGRVGRRRWSPTPCQGCVTCPNSAQLDNPHAAHSTAPPGAVQLCSWAEIMNDRETILGLLAGSNGASRGRGGDWRIVTTLGGRQCAVYPLYQQRCIHCPAAQ